MSFSEQIVCDNAFYSVLSDLEVMALGMTDAFVVSRIRSLIYNNINKGCSNVRDGRHWIYNSVAALQAKFFPMMTVKVLRSALERLRDNGILHIGNYNYNRYDRSLWYSVDEIKLNRVVFDCSKNTDSPMRFKSVEAAKLYGLTEEEFPHYVIGYYDPVNENDEFQPEPVDNFVDNPVDNFVSVDSSCATSANAFIPCGQMDISSEGESKQNNTQSSSPNKPNPLQTQILILKAKEHFGNIKGFVDKAVSLSMKFGCEKVLKQIDNLINKKDSIRSKIGWLITAVSNDYSFDSKKQNIENKASVCPACKNTGTIYEHDYDGNVINSFRCSCQC